MRQARGLFAGVLLALPASLLAGCGDNRSWIMEGPEEPAREEPVAIVVQPAQVTLRAGQSVQLSAQVNDALGQPVGGAELSFTPSDPSMLRVSLRGELVAVGSPGQGHVRVSSGAVTRDVGVTVMPGPPSRMILATGSNQSAMVGMSLAELITVQVADAFGNILPGTTVRFEADTDAGALAQPDVTTTDEKGMTGTAWTLGRTVGRQVLKASTETGTAALDVLATALPGSARQLVKIGGDDTAAVAGETAILRVQVQDNFGNPVPGVGVEWQVSAGEATLGSAAPETDASGLAEAALRTPGTVSVATVTATIGGDNGRQSVVFSVPGRSGPAATLKAVAGEVQTARAGRPVKVRPAVRVTDVHGNPVEGAAVEFAVTPGDGRVEGATQVTGKDGVATVGNWLPGTGRENELRATVAGLDAKAVFRAKTQP